MKKLFPLFIFVLTSIYSFSQAPESISYQAVIRNANQELVTEASVGVQISILQGTATGNSVYTETHTATTNANGLLSIAIGNGTTTDNFATIDWSQGPYFIKTETDPTGGSNYTITGTSQLLSVPFALHAKTSESQLPGPKGEKGAPGIDGKNGKDGENGLSTYQIWLNLGNTGTETDFINSLKGPQGPQGVEGPEGPTAQVHLTQAFIPLHPDSTERLSLAFVTAATGPSSYSEGASPPEQVYDYDILDSDGHSIFTDDVALKSPDNAKRFREDETNLRIAPESYSVVIIGSSEEEPVAPARVDIWVSDIVSDIESIVFSRILYQFSWSASKEWIFERWRENGGSYIGLNYPKGIPLLINTNHTFKP
ncbi:hypothetical protein CLV33_102407 [Jejuia pallidilutea]|uniref:Collagen-like protein n=1 Tax=Jejuia pallidilutea TaxID=504487 RepID=A0A362X2C2_9FLAO|nr:collagen-like protein [Jejuia pallidilutea]PQV50543.1 hypothetical protein CLV33_102407 [Jejuia pallidilutea]